ARQGPDAVRIEIGGDEGAAYPAHGSRRCGIDPFDRRMPVRRAQHDAVQLAGHSDVVEIASLPGQKPPVFQAAARAPDMLLGHPVTIAALPRARARNIARRGIMADPAGQKLTTSAYRVPRAVERIEGREQIPNTAIRLIQRPASHDIEEKRNART